MSKFWKKDQIGGVIDLARETGPSSKAISVNVNGRMMQSQVNFTISEVHEAHWDLKNGCLVISGPDRNAPSKTKRIYCFGPGDTEWVYINEGENPYDNGAFRDKLAKRESLAEKEQLKQQEKQLKKELKKNSNKEGKPIWLKIILFPFKLIWMILKGVMSVARFFVQLPGD